MKTIILFFLLSLPLLTATESQGQEVEKTLVKSFNLEGNQVVLLDLDGKVEMKIWNNKLLRIHILVSLENGTEAILKSLVQTGRYNLTGDDSGGEFKVRAPGLQKKVTARGRELSENISYIVFVPEKVSVKRSNEVSTCKILVKNPTQF